MARVVSPAGLGLACLLAVALLVRYLVQSTWVAVVVALYWLVGPLVLSPMLVLLSVPLGGFALAPLHGGGFALAWLLWALSGAGVACGTTACTLVCPPPLLPEMHSSRAEDAGQSSTRRLNLRGRLLAVSNWLDHASHTSAHALVSRCPRRVKLLINSAYTLACEFCLAPCAVSLLALEAAVLALGLAWHDPLPVRLAGRQFAVFLVHGLGFNQVEWVFARAVWALHLDADHDARPLYVRSFNYHRGGAQFLAQRRDTIELYAERLATALHEFAGHCPDGVDVVLIGHSLGGLVAAQCAHSHAASVPARCDGIRLRGIVTIASPFGGSDIVEPLLRRPLLTWLFGLRNSDVIEQLRPGNTTVRALAQRIAHDDSQPPCVAVVAGLDIIVRPHSARLGATNAEEAAHFGYLHHYNVVLSRTVCLHALNEARRLLRLPQATSAAAKRARMRHSAGKRA